MTPLLSYLFIFTARVIDVSLATVRVLFVFRGRKIEASLIGFFEVLIFVTVLGRVVTSLDNPLNALAYAGGFATGSLLGGFVEEKLAFGHVATQIISKEREAQIRDAVREAGYGLTVIHGEGRNGPRNVLMVISRRKDVSRLLKIVDDIDGNAVVVMTDARRTIHAFQSPMGIRKGK